MRRGAGMSWMLGCGVCKMPMHSIDGLPYSLLASPHSLCIVAYLFPIFTQRGRPDMAPFIFIDRISRGKPIKQFGDGSTSRDYTYIDDIVDGVIRAVDRPYDYEVFNLGKGDGTSLKDFINLVQKYTKKNATINVLPEQPGDVPCKFCVVCRLIGIYRHIL